MRPEDVRVGMQFGCDLAGFGLEVKALDEDQHGPYAVALMEGGCFGPGVYEVIRIPLAELTHPDGQWIPPRTFTRRAIRPDDLLIGDGQEPVIVDGLPLIRKKLVDVIKK
jgi:hypothetical protein